MKKDKCEDLHAQRAEGVRAMLSARKTGRQHLGHKIERACSRTTPTRSPSQTTSQSEIDLLVQEAQTYRDEDDAENGLQNVNKFGHADGRKTVCVNDAGHATAKPPSISPCPSKQKR